MLCESHPLTQLFRETSELGLFLSILVQIRNVTLGLNPLGISLLMEFGTHAPCLTQRWQQIPGCGFLRLWNQRPLFTQLSVLQRLPPTLSSTQGLVYLFSCHCFACALGKVMIALILMTPLPGGIYLYTLIISSLYYHPLCAPHVLFFLGLVNYSIILSYYY